MPPADLSKIVSRIASALAGRDALDMLTRGLPPSDLQSLLLHVLRARSEGRTPQALMAQYERSAMVRPSTGDARALHEIERLAFECAEGFEAIELAPIAPLGVNGVLGANYGLA